ncbi:MAG: tRNA (N6-threonylcarbamoyladenosine(37)-N6)-methyltransferase TrmO [Clostridia bacterium]|nr:tRNA (N6-threonylcarbamoyladenosine(37)-N6)-methyltransferase TrmO [Clostridia bacterium]
MDKLKVIARIRCDFPTKFGIPRQSGLVDELKAEIVFEKEYRDGAACRGLDGFSHIWLIWGFSKAEREGWSPTVRPPKLGGNVRMGVFATRSPFRPNPIGLSCVRLEGVSFEEGRGPVLKVSGADLMDGTPIYDIKPYLPLADCHTDATSGFAAETAGKRLEVVLPHELAEAIPQDKLEALKAVLAEDPRPGYQDDPEREYGFFFADKEVSFKVQNGILTVTQITEGNCAHND